MVILVGLAIDQIAQSGLSSLSVIYYSAQLFSTTLLVHHVLREHIQNRQQARNFLSYKPDLT
ncbi:sugar-binding protein [Salmonella enterica subsp. enterica]|nr:sugar-binding protein [Salmonella enterica subsp. enterica]